MPFPWLAVGTLAANIGGALFGQHRQQESNRDLAAFQHNKNMELLKYQLDYNSPVQQMERYREAGLNPNLIYGQGTSGNMESPPRYPDIKPADLQSGLVNLGTQFQQMRLMEGQADLVQVKAQESGVKQDVMRVQQNLMKANPWLNKSYVEATITMLQSSATLKKQESDFMTSVTTGTPGARPQLDDTTHQEIGFHKMNAELQTLFNKWDLQEKDKQIKARIFESKGFQNDLSKIQLNWMKDGDITPQHIYMGIMLLLSKMM